MKTFRLNLFLCIALLVCCASAFSQTSQKHSEFPCRVSDSANEDVFVMTLGDVRTPLAQGMFNPENDEVRLKSV